MSPSDLGKDKHYCKDFEFTLVLHIVLQGCEKGAKIQQFRALALSSHANFAVSTMGFSKKHTHRS